MTPPPNLSEGLEWNALVRIDFEIDQKVLLAITDPKGLTSQVMWALLMVAPVSKFMLTCKEIEQKKSHKIYPLQMDFQE